MTRRFFDFFSRGQIFSSGTGSKNDPFIIDTPNRLAAINKYSDKHFRLVAHIDMKDIPWTPVGSRNEKFSGSLDGNGYIIKNLVIELPTEDNIGFFGWVDRGAEIMSLALEECSIVGKNFVGGMAGVNIGSISRCYITGKVSGKSHVGGLVGWNVEHGSISNCFALAEVKGEDSVGGLVGANFDTVSHCYAAGKVKGQRKYVGGAVGLDYLNFRGEVKESYYDANIAGKLLVDKDFARTSSEMKSRNLYQNWDFEKVWNIREGKNYPYLQVFANNHREKTTENGET